MRYTDVFNALALLSGPLFVDANPLSYLESAYNLARRNTQEQGSVTDFIWPFLSTGCQSALGENLKAESQLGQCLHLTDVQTAMPDGNLTVDAVDKLLHSVCTNSPCSDDCLNGAIESIASGCASEFAMFGFNATLLYEGVNLYKASRDVACLKTTNPYGALGTSSSGYCLTSLYQQYEAAFSADPSPLTDLYAQLTAALQGGNAGVTEELKTALQPYLCIDSVFAILDVVEVAYPSLQTLATSENATLNACLEGTCQAYGLTVQLDGSLPKNVTETALQPQTNALSMALGLNEQAAKASSVRRRWFPHDRH